MYVRNDMYNMQYIQFLSVATNCSGESMYVRNDMYNMQYIQFLSVANKLSGESMYVHNDITTYGGGGEEYM